MYINNPDLLMDINPIEYIPSSIFCRDSYYASLLDSASLADSKLKYVIGIFDTIQVKGEISPTLIATEILEVFNANDFEHDYYRTIGLVKTFLLEASDKTDIDLPLIGSQKTSKGIIRGTSYDFYIAVQNELMKAYKEIRDMYSIKYFNSNFDNLDKEKQKVIKDLVPLRISEAEPGK